jgi:sugar/nucleoside kinase (ribokinase family)
MGSGRRWDLVAWGDPCADVVFSAAALPTVGDKVLGQPMGTFGGGTEANVACAAARLGLRTALAGRVGADAQAQALAAGLEAFGVSTELLEHDAKAPSASALTMIAPSGDRAIVYLPMPPAPAQAWRLREASSEADVVYTMPYDLDGYLWLAHVAHECGARVAIDLESAVAPDPQAMRARASQADIVFFNESGFRAGTGAAPAPAVLQAVLALGPEVVVVSLGAAGAIACSRGACARQPALPAQVVDTTGAGDTFNAAFLAAWLEGQALASALRFACAAGSFAVSALGARAGMPVRAQVQAAVDRHPGAQGGIAC